MKNKIGLLLLGLILVGNLPSQEIISGGSVGAGSGSGDATVAELQAGTAFLCPGASGSDAYSCTMDPVIEGGPADGAFVKLIPDVTSAGTANLDVCTGGSTPCPKNIYRLFDQGVLEAEDLLANSPAWLNFCAACDSPDGAWILINPAAGSPTPAAHASTHEDGGADEIDLTGLSGVDHGTIGGLEDNDHPFYEMPACNATSELTLDTNGAITVPAGGGGFTLDTFADAATDTLVTINGTAGNNFCFKAENAARVVTIQASTIQIRGAIDFAFDEDGDHAWGSFTATNTPLVRDVLSEDGEEAAASYRIGVGGAFTTSLQFLFYNGGSALAENQTIWLKVPYACNITGWELVADQSGSVTIDLWVDSFAAFPPTDADSITAAATPALSTAQTDNDTTLTDWTTLIPSG
jgi:hypothetical protein